MKYYDIHGEYCNKEYAHFVRKSEYDHLKQLLRNVRTTLHFSPEDVLAIDAALREDEDSCSKLTNVMVAKLVSL